jgi:polyhydroxybutyrate depolymerase
MRRWLPGLLCVCVFVTLMGCQRNSVGSLTGTPSANVAPGDYHGALLSNGLTRTFITHIPPQYTAHHPLPIMLSLHGRLGDGQGQITLSHMSAVADQYGFIVVYPDGYQRSWNDGRPGTPAHNAQIDDVAFLSNLIDVTLQTYGADAHHIYVSGMSNGGFMTETLGCQLANKIAAIGIVAATFTSALAPTCTPAQPLPVMLFNGDADPLVPYTGGPLGDRGTVLSAADTAQRWAALNTCASSPDRQELPDVHDGTHVVAATYTGCRSAVSVVWYTIQHGGHTWPNGEQYLPVAVIGKTTHAIDASIAIWLFCSHYQR